MAKTGERYLRKWVDHPDNPLIEPPWPEFLLGDPTVVLPGESPDGNWHMLANTLLGIHHYRSPDGLNWRRLGRLFGGMRAFAIKEDDTYYCFFEEFTVPMFRSHVSLRTSKDLLHWSDSSIVIEPTFKWERKLGRTVGNPCVVRTGDGYRLYYSAGLVFLKDLGFCEPLHIGAAHAPSMTGPYRKLSEPIISPSPDDPYRNLGAGAIKVIRDFEQGTYYGFNNGIYSDEKGRTRSAVMLMSSDDGMSFRDVFPEPIIAPEGEGWKKALVYQLDVKRVGGEMWLYYNARSGWRFGKERIGLATCGL